MAKVVFAGDQTNWPVCVCVCQCSLVVVQNASDSHNLTDCDFRVTSRRGCFCSQRELTVFESRE